MTDSVEDHHEQTELPEESTEAKPLFDAEAVAEDTIARVTRRYEALTEDLFFLLPDIVPIPSYLAYQSGPLRENILTLVRIANGEVDLEHFTDAELHILQYTIQDVVEVMCIPPMGAEGYAVPDTFWNIPIGRVIQYVHILQRGDDLISYTQAAKILFPDERLDASVAIKRIARRIENGLLQGYSDPRVPNPKHARRVSRRAVEQLASTRNAGELEGEERTRE